MRINFYAKRISYFFDCCTLWCLTVLLKLAPLFGMITRSLIYTCALQYVLIPRSPWSDYHPGFYNLWLCVFIVLFVFRLEHGISINGSLLLDIHNRHMERKNHE